MSLESFERIAVVGATGAVGTEVLRLLEERGVPAERVLALASAKSEGVAIEYADGMLTVRETSDGTLEGADLALFCASAAVSRRFIPGAVERGTLVVDNSSAFRMQEGVPLVVPEVNGELIDGTDGNAGRLIANPNCSTILLLVALEPLRRAFGIERIVVSTYQAVSGAGAKGMEELVEQTRGELCEATVNRAATLAVPPRWSCGAANGVTADASGIHPEEPESRGTARASIFPEPCSFNVFSHNSAVDVESGLNVEEQKLIDETRKIWNDESVAISPTCVRVPVLRAHSEAVTVTVHEHATVEEVRAALRAAPGVEVIDDRAGNCFPTPRKATGRDGVLVGRVRRDPAAAVTGAGRTRGFSLWLCGDQLRKGAALNAVQIAERVGAMRTESAPVRMTVPPGAFGAAGLRSPYGRDVRD